MAEKFISKLLIFFILSFTSVHSVSAINDNGTNCTLTRNQFSIHYNIPDSIYAEQAAAALSKAFDEITYDFQLKRSEHFDVIIVPTRKAFRDALRGRLPAWTGAFANPDQNRMVVKSPRWNPGRNFNATLTHELFHLIIHKFLGPRSLPRWMDEGLAIFYSGEERWKTATALSKAISTNSLIPLEEVEYVLEYHQAKADLAYQQSYFAVHYLLTTYDIDAVRQIVYGLESGKSINACFLSATGSSFHDFEVEWQDYARQTHRWLWFYEIDQYVWIFIFVLVILAFVAKKIRNKKIEQQWQREQELFLEDKDEDI